MNDREPSSDKKQEMSPMELIAELYRLSDLILSAQPDAPRPAVQKIESAKERLVELTGVQNQDLRTPEPREDHQWILSVLEDLSKYAASKHLTSIESELLRARARIGEFLNARQ